MEKILKMRTAIFSFLGPLGAVPACGRKSELLFFIIIIWLDRTFPNLLQSSTAILHCSVNGLLYAFERGWSAYYYYYY